MYSLMLITVLTEQYGLLITFNYVALNPSNWDGLHNIFPLLRFVILLFYSL